MSVHKDLTGADLHEPKGADTATAGKVYVSDGAGSGVWTDASLIITNTAFTTGDTKLTYKTTADTTWILASYAGTIGDGSSSSTIRANADTEDLFALYWDNCANSICPVFTSAGAISTRGASAAADFAAHKRLQIPTVAGRVLGIAGSSELTTRDLGATTGTETVTLSAAQLPSLTSSASNSISVLSSVSGIPYNATGINSLQASTGSDYGWYSISTPGPVTQVTSTGNNTITVTSSGTLGQAHSNMQPSAFLNLMIKL